MTVRLLIATALALNAAHVQAQSSKALDQQTQAMMNASFREQGIAGMDRLAQDDVQKACSQAKPPSAALAKKLEAAQLASVQWPSDGKYLGDWKEGEKLAQNGRGMTWTDASADPARNGAMCYNCHQIDKKEISYGSIGPSLWNYGKLRAVSDPNSPTAAATVKYTWAKLWNAKAYSACSHMPRFGQAKLLTEQQLRDVMALLLDPQSPVNQ